MLNGDALPSQPILRLPAPDAIVDFSDVKFQRLKSKDNNIISEIVKKYNESIEYSLFFCENILPVTCEGLVIPKEYVDKSVIVSSAVVTLGGSSAGLLIFGLVGNTSRRKRICQSLVLIVVAVILNACNSGLEAAKPKPTTNNLQEGLIEFPVGSLQPKTTYY